MKIKKRDYVYIPVTVMVVWPKLTPAIPAGARMTSVMVPPACAAVIDP